MTTTCGRLLVEPSGPSLKGKTEYETDSPSFLGSKGLFGLAGIPTANNTRNELLKLHAGLLLLVTYTHSPFTFVKNQLCSPTVTFSVFELSLKVSKASGILVPGNLRELNNSLRIWKTHIDLKKNVKSDKQHLMYLLYIPTKNYGSWKVMKKLWKIAFQLKAKFKISIFKVPCSTKVFSGEDLFQE